MISQDSLLYDAVMRLMDQVEQVDRKVSALLSAAGTGDTPAGSAAGGGRADGRPERQLCGRNMASMSSVRS